MMTRYNAAVGLLFILTDHFLLSCHSANILFTITHFSLSHKKSVAPIAKILADAGHNVTIWHPGMKFEQMGLGNVNELDSFVDVGDQLIKDVLLHENATEQYREMIDQPEPNYGDNFPMLYDLEADICKHVFLQKPDHIRALFDDTKWDLLFFDTLIDVCGLTIGTVRNIRHISLSTMNFLEPTIEFRNLPYAYSSFPLLIASDYDHRAFYWRTLAAYNVLLRMYYWITSDGIQRKIMQELEPTMSEFSIKRFEEDAILAMAMQPVILDYPKPSAPDIFYLGVTCPVQKLLKPMPADVQSFIEDPTSAGTIIAGFGHWMHWEAAPEHFIEAFLSAFAQFHKYRFVFHYNGPALTDVPRNVLISSWFPQQQLLSHPKTRLFITHCGMKSFIEAVCNRVPVVTFPLFVEQPRNALTISRYLKLGPYVSKFTLTAQTLAAGIKDGLENPEYKNRISKLADQVADISPTQPDKEFTWRIETMLRHPHRIQLTESKSKRMNRIVFFSIDVMVFLSIIVFLFFTSLVCIILRIYTMVKHLL